MHEDEKKATYRNIIIVFIFALIYSVLRYNLIKGVAWDHLPMFIANKVFALAGVMLICLAILTKRKMSNIVQNIQYRRFGYFFISLHVLVSLTLLNPVTYDKFYDHGQMNLTGELSMLLGVIAFYVFSLSIFRSWFDSEESRNREMVKKDVLYRYLTHFLVMGHLLVMGIESWLVPAEWPGYMLPISFLSFLFLLFILPVSMQRQQNPQSN